MTDRPPCECCYGDDMQKNNRRNNGNSNDLSFHCAADEMYELLSKLPESVAYMCTKCTERHPPEWRTALERELQGCIRNVLTALLNSRTSTHLLRYRQVRYPCANCCEICRKYFIFPFIFQVLYDNSLWVVAVKLRTAN